MFQHRYAFFYCASSDMSCARAGIALMGVLDPVLCTVCQNIHRITTDTSTNSQNRELFKFARVIAFPNASNVGTASAIPRQYDLNCRKYSTMCFVVSLLPDPVIPVISMDCDFLERFKFVMASFAENREPV